MINFKKVLVAIIILLISIIPLKVSAEENTLYNRFIENVSNATSSHYILKSKNFDYYLMNDDMIVYVVIGEINNELNLNILFVKKNSSAFLRVTNNDGYKNYYTDQYGVIYNIKYDFNTNIKIDICFSGLTPVLDSANLPVFETIDQYKELGVIITNGSGAFPDNTLSNTTIGTKQVLLIIMIVGIVICLVMGFLLVFMVKNKKVNVRREDYFGYSQNQKDSFDNVINQEDYIHADYSLDEEKEETKVQKGVYTKADLIDLYRKKFNNEITDAEFDYALKKYLSTKEDEDQDD